MAECTVERVSIPENTKRRVFAESAGYCGKPTCHLPLFPDDSQDIHFAELAHVISATSGGPRDVPSSVMSAVDRSKASNLILLCANCHTIIDKDPVTFPIEIVMKWRREHQQSLEATFGFKQFETRAEARACFTKFLERNAASFRLHGPGTREADKPGSSRAAKWARHALNVIIPNNRSLLHLAEMNRPLLGAAEIETVGDFMVHVEDFEARHLWNDWSAGGRRYPGEFSNLFKEGIDDQG